MYLLTRQLWGGPEILHPSQTPCRCWSYWCTDHTVRSENIAPPLLRSLAKRRNDKNTRGSLAGHNSKHFCWALSSTQQYKLKYYLTWSLFSPCFRKRSILSSMYVLLFCVCVGVSYISIFLDKFLPKCKTNFREHDIGGQVLFLARTAVQWVEHKV